MKSATERFSPYERTVVALLVFLQFTLVLDFMVMAPLGAVIMPAFEISPYEFSLLHGVELIVSSLWGPALLILIIGATQISINAFTASFAAIVVGLAGDNSIQFMFAYRKGQLENSVHSRGAAALFTSAVMAICSLTFLAAAYRPPKIMGALLFVGFLLNFYGDYAILVGLLKPKEKQIG